MLHLFRDARFPKLGHNFLTSKFTLKHGVWFLRQNTPHCTNNLISERLVWEQFQRNFSWLYEDMAKIRAIFVRLEEFLESAKCIRSVCGWTAFSCKVIEEKFEGGRIYAIDRLSLRWNYTLELVNKPRQKCFFVSFPKLDNLKFRNIFWEHF